MSVWYVYKYLTYYARHCRSIISFLSGNNIRIMKDALYDYSPLLTEEKSETWKLYATV